MVVYETDVPGVGKRFELEIRDGERLVVIVHHDGKREVFRRSDPDADAEKMFDLSSGEARDFANVLQGADFQPLDLDDADVPLGDAIMEWVEVPEGSPATGQTLADLELRQEAGTTIAAIQREGGTLGSPGPDTVLAASDILVAIGTREAQQSLQSVLEPDADE